MRPTLTEAQRLEILAAKKRGEDRATIGKRFGVPPDYVRNLRNKPAKQSDAKLREERLWARAKANMALDAEK